MSSDLRTDDDAVLVLADLLAAEPGQEPTAGTAVAGAGPVADEAYVVLPSLDRPRYVLPAAAPRAAAAHLRPSRGFLAGVASHAVAGPAIRAGALRLASSRTLAVPAGPPGWLTLAARLSRELGRGPLALSIALGPPRPNRKPVIRLSDTDGHAIGWAKVGTSRHAAALVREEAAFLGGPGPGHLRQAGIEPPELLAHFTWKGCPVAVGSALPATVGTRVRPLRLTAAVIDAIAACDSAGERPGPAADSAWWKGIEARLDEVPAAYREAADRAAGAVLDRLGPIELRYGRWHGDLASWNAQWVGQRLLAWDWERTEDPVPVGFDALHQTFQFSLLRHRHPVAAARRATAEDNRALLAEVGVSPASAAAVTAGYCLTFALRLLDDARFASLDPAADAIVGDLLADLAGGGAP